MSLLETTINGRKRRSNHATVVAGLGRGIVSGTFPEGSLLPGDTELSARFGVSRTVLREAMKTLSAKRLVEAKAKVGTRVLDSSSWNFFDADVLSWRFETSLDYEFIEHLAEMRTALEPAAAAAAALRATSDDIVSLYAIAAKFDNLNHTPESIANVDLEFHLAIARMSGNPFMRSASALIEAALAISFQLSSPAASPEMIDEVASNHLRIAHAIASRDPQKAMSAMRHVIDVGKIRIRTSLDAAENVPGNKTAELRFPDSTRVPTS
ncbi:MULTISPECIES: FadR/GntR family transcriptional regulator [unclassified Rhizobium]|uniref:DNA-binding FadR family transcriptional regulator n=1 Tax=Rhizobium soli TaxID=424798 RepID=A0A7X0JJW3_9HYPH|nr:DNA-binding FadR family transcriptional regulator [Rhizobium soli]MBD8652156.1 FadR family transcriptional regulator [Rhizobium sp. CFBP 13726]MBD8661649.1 FadR family transcriptional regulator [Rhizobium sp. CFBP 8752]MBP2462727.1 DNA-binding FadR family transcriptional regulator [Rhizobium sp. PvP014]MBP2530121.1 DNA-binding FadR family transcriptional regulator [Rhizobium sp. PvP099]NSY18989.1 FadR family transcriptional regulator [Neorhizobium sp. AL 9.2.2]SEH20830.1 DNA-binding transc